VQLTHAVLTILLYGSRSVLTSARVPAIISTFDIAMAGISHAQRRATRGRKAVEDHEDHEDDVERAQRLLPLTPATFAILLALASGEKHGYAIMREIATASAGALRVGPGTLYHSIKQLLAAGIIDESGDRPDPALDDQRRRYYRLTPFGRRVVQAEAVRLARLVRQASATGLLGGEAGEAGGGRGGRGGSDVQPGIGIGGAP